MKNKFSVGVALAILVLSVFSFNTNFVFGAAGSNADSCSIVFNTGSPSGTNNEDVSLKVTEIVGTSYPGGGSGVTVDWGDGNTLIVPNKGSNSVTSPVTHTYSSAGTYTITGSTGDFTNGSCGPLTVTVTSPTPPPAPTSYRVTSTHSTGGTVYVANTTSADTTTDGSPVSFTASPQTGYSTSLQVTSSPAGCTSLPEGFSGSTYTSGTISADCNFNFNFTPNPSGTLNAGGCTVASGSSSCNIPVNWSVTNAPAGSDTAVTTPNNISVGTGTSGSTNYSFTLSANSASVPFYLYNNSVELARATAIVSCSAGSTWDATLSKCAPLPTVTVTASPMAIDSGASSTISWTSTDATSCSYAGAGVATSGSFSSGPLTTNTTYTIYCNNAAGTAYGSVTVSVAGAPDGSIVTNFPSCSIPAGSSTCSLNFTWNTANPKAGYVSEVTTPTNVTVFTGNNGTNQPHSIPQGSSTYYLYHAGMLLDQVTLNGICATGTDYVSGVCKTKPTITVTQAANGTITPSGTTSVVYGSNSTTITLTPASGYVVASHIINGASTTTSATSYTFTNITSNQTFTATFAPIPAGMSGSLSGPASCSIAAGGNSCSATLSWSINNPEGTPTAITASGMTNINVSNTLTASQSGTQAVTVPYSSRIFYLYNNAKSLVPTSPTGAGITVAATCAGGTSWDTATGTCKTTPTCVSTQGNTCTSAGNSCGQTNVGTIACDGSCSATVPSNAGCSTGGSGGSGDKCPAGYTGTYPNCTGPQSCPSGTTPNTAYPNCKLSNGSSCPAPSTGTYPNCVWPTACPTGYTGTYPNCVGQKVPIFQER